MQAVGKLPIIIPAAKTPESYYPLPNTIGAG